MEISFGIVNQNVNGAPAFGSLVLTSFKEFGKHFYNSAPVDTVSRLLPKL